MQFFSGMKKLPSKVAHNRPNFFFHYSQPAQNQPKSHFLLHKNFSLHNFYIMTLILTYFAKLFRNRIVILLRFFITKVFAQVSLSGFLFIRFYEELYTFACNVSLTRQVWKVWKKPRLQKYISTRVISKDILGHSTGIC